MSVIGKAWKTPLEKMKVRGGRAKILDVPIIATGIWKGTVVNEENIDEVVAFQKEEGPIHVVTDHMEDVRDWVGLAFDFRKSKNPAGYFEILATIEITEDELIKKLKFQKEYGGGFCGISPRIEWQKRDEEGNIEGLSTPHVSVVVHPAQGWITKMSATHVSAYADLVKDAPPEKCRCPKCGETVDKERGKPCQSVKCPKCKTTMVGYWPEEDKSMAGLGTVKMSVADFAKNKPKVCPKCGTFIPKGANKCPKCGAKLEAYTIVRCLDCQAIFDFASVKDNKCPNCGAELKDLDIIIPFAEVEDNEDVVIPKNFLKEIDDILKNPNIEAPTMRGFFERLRENLKKKKKEEDEPKGDEEKMEKCPECGKEVTPKDGKCPECGAEMKKKEKEEDQAKEVKCPECGKTVTPKDGKCPECGAEIKEPDPEKDKEHTAYAVPTQGGISKIAEHTYSKELLKVGTFRHPDGFGLIPITDSFLQKLIDNTNKCFGGRVPCYIGHPEIGKEPADKIIGWVSDLKLDGSLLGKVEVTNALVNERVDEGTLKDASVGIALCWLDEKGNDVSPVITHMAITTTPFIRNLEAFQKLAASRTDTKVKVMEQIEGDPLGLKQIRKEMDEMKSKYGDNMKDLSSKYEKLLESTLQEKTEKILERVDRLVDSELLKPGFKERVSEFVRKTKGAMFNDKRSVPEEFLEILESGLVKGESVTSQETDDTTDTREYVTEEDLATYRGRINGYERDGIIGLDKQGRPYWTKGRPDISAS